MTGTDQLREAIDRATAAPVTPPDVAALQRGGRRRRAGRAAGTALATIAVVAGGIAGVQSLGGSGDKAAPASLPDRQSTAYISYDTTRALLHWGDRVLPVKHQGRLDVGSPTMTRVGLVYLGVHGTPYLLDKSGDTTALGDPVVERPDVRDGWAEVVSDTAGDYAAWTYYAHGQVTVSRFDAATRKVTTSPTFDCAAVAPDCDYATAHVLDHGVVYLTALVGGGARDSTIAWDPSRPAGERLYPLTDPGTSLAAAGKDHLVLAGDGPAYGGPDHAPLPASTKVSRIGKGEARTATSTEMSPDGKWRIVGSEGFVDKKGQYLNPLVRGALNVDTGRMVTLDVPGEIEDAAFDDDGSVLVFVNTGHGRQLDDCAIPSGSCRTVVTDVKGDAAFPDGKHT